MHSSTSQTELLGRLEHALADEDDLVAALATVVCELFQAFVHHHWVGFYRVVASQTLKVGPYQGGHGCTTLRFDQGVCGACARTRQVQRIPDVTRVPHHIACSSSTRSEIVLPVTDAAGRLIAVLDIDSDEPDAFDAAEQAFLERVAALFGRRCWAGAPGGSASPAD